LKNGASERGNNCVEPSHSSTHDVSVFETTEGHSLGVPCHLNIIQEKRIRKIYLLITARTGCTIVLRAQARLACSASCRHHTRWLDTPVLLCTFHGARRGRIHPLYGRLHVGGGRWWSPKPPIYGQGCDAVKCIHASFASVLGHSPLSCTQASVVGFRVTTPRASSRECRFP